MSGTSSRFWQHRLVRRSRQWGSVSGHRQQGSVSGQRGSVSERRQVDRELESTLFIPNGVQVAVVGSGVQVAEVDSWVQVSGHRQWGSVSESRQWGTSSECRQWGSGSKRWQRGSSIKCRHQVLVWDVGSGVQVIKYIVSHPSAIASEHLRLFKNQRVVQQSVLLKSLLLFAY